MVEWRGKEEESVFESIASKGKKRANRKEGGLTKMCVLSREVDLASSSSSSSLERSLSLTP
jgi:hypothetical protein